MFHQRDLIIPLMIVSASGESAPIFDRDRVQGLTLAFEIWRLSTSLNRSDRSIEEALAEGLGGGHNHPCEIRTPIGFLIRLYLHLMDEVF